jgi:hypothetical protein
MLKKESRRRKKEEWLWVRGIRRKRKRHVTT